MVTQNTDYATDDMNTTRLFEPVRESSGWVGRSGSITRDSSGTFYIAERLRTGDTDRGHYFRGHSNSNDITATSDWTQEWEISNEDVGTDSFEDVSLRIFDGTFYLYFCWDTPDDTITSRDWLISYVSASSFGELGTQLSDSANWTDILGKSSKDPAVFEVEGNYYMQYQGNASSVKELHLIKSSDPAFQSYTTVYDTFMSEYDSTHGATGDTNSGTLVYDDSAETWILWSSITNNDVYAAYATSPDLQTFSYSNRELVVSGTTDQTGDFRYPDYYGTSENGYVMIMEYSGLELSDSATDGEQPLYLWDYR